LLKLSCLTLLRQAKASYLEHSVRPNKSKQFSRGIDIGASRSSSDEIAIRSEKLARLCPPLCLGKISGKAGGRAKLRHEGSLTSG
jgi:hypothetical protein